MPQYPGLIPERQPSDYYQWQIARNETFHHRKRLKPPPFLKALYFQHLFEFFRSFLIAYPLTWLWRTATPQPKPAWLSVRWQIVLNYLLLQAKAPLISILAGYFGNEYYLRGFLMFYM